MVDQSRFDSNQCRVVAKFACVSETCVVYVYTQNSTSSVMRMRM